MRTCCTCNVDVAIERQESALISAAFPAMRTTPPKPAARTKPRVCQPSCSADLRRGGVVGSCLDCCMQQAMPQVATLSASQQQFSWPSFVPQTRSGPTHPAESGVQMATAPMLTMSKAMTDTRIIGRCGNIRCQYGKGAYNVHLKRTTVNRAAATRISGLPCRWISVAGDCQRSWQETMKC